MSITLWKRKRNFLVGNAHLVISTEDFLCWLVVGNALLAIVLQHSENRCYPLPFERLQGSSTCQPPKTSHENFDFHTCEDNKRWFNFHLQNMIFETQSIHIQKDEQNVNKIKAASKNIKDIIQIDINSNTCLKSDKHFYPSAPFFQKKSITGTFECFFLSLSCLNKHAKERFLVLLIPDIMFRWLV